MDPEREERRHIRRRQKLRLKAALLGRSRGGQTKVHLAADRKFRPLAFILTAGQAADSPQFIPVLKEIQVKRKVFAINPPAAARDRHAVTRKKSDPGDVLVLANILRTDMHAHRPLPDDSDLGRAIAVLARAQQDALWNRQRIANQLRSLLREYYPAALNALATWANGLCRPEARELLKAAPTPSRAARLTRPLLQTALKRSGRQRGTRPKPTVSMTRSAPTGPTSHRSSKRLWASRYAPYSSSWKPHAPPPTISRRRWRKHSLSTRTPRSC